MAWIESHSNLARHPKTRRLMKLLGWSLPDTIGNLHLLWWWAQDFAPTGDLSCFSAEDLTADLDLCGATPEQFLEAMIHAGFIDRLSSGSAESRSGGTMVASGFLDRIEETLCIHDWADYQRPKSHRKSAGAPRPAEEARESKVLPSDPQATPSTSPSSSAPPSREQEPAARRVTPTHSDISSDEPPEPEPETHPEASSNPAPAHSLPEQEFHSANAEDDSTLGVPPGRESQIPHLLDEQPGFTNVWWPKFLEMYADKGCPLTSYEQREFLKRLLEKPHSAVPMLKTSVERYRSNLQGSSARPSRLAIAGAGTKREEHLENTS